jgi:histidinol-phosphatase
MYADELAFAHLLADAAAPIAMELFADEGLEIRHKADRTLVTAADLEIERMVRDRLATAFPEDRIMGEEEGGTFDGAGRVWIIDPIDGTANYLKGIPMWTVLIALSIDGVPRVGVASQPALGRRWWAATGLGAWTSTADGITKQIHVSDVHSISESSASFQSISQWDEVGKLDELMRLTRAVWRDRGYGDTWPYMLLAEGRLEFVAEFGVKEYDIAALVPIITEAGGRFTSFDGNDSLAERSSLATNGILHDAFLSLLHSR